MTITTKHLRTAWGIAFAGCLVLEAVALVRPEKDDTLSEVQDDLAKDAPIIPFAVGAVAGHWYHPSALMAPFLGGVAVGSALWQLRRSK